RNPMGSHSGVSFPIIERQRSFQKQNTCLPEDWKKSQSIAGRFVGESSVHNETAILAKSAARCLQKFGSLGQIIHPPGIRSKLDVAKPQALHSVFHLPLYAFFGLRHRVDGSISLDPVTTQAAQKLMHGFLLHLSFDVPESHVNAAHGVHDEATATDVVRR